MPCNRTNCPSQYKEIKERIALRPHLIYKVINGWGDLWDEYCLLRREVKNLFREKRYILEIMHVDFDGSRKEFWTFVGKKTKGKKWNNYYCFKA